MKIAVNTLFDILACAFVKTEEEAKHIHETRLQRISFKNDKIAKVTHIQNIVVLWYFPSEMKIPSMFLVPRILLYHCVS